MSPERRPLLSEEDLHRIRSRFGMASRARVRADAENTTALADMVQKLQKYKRPLYVSPNDIVEAAESTRNTQLAHLATEWMQKMPNARVNITDNAEGHTSITLTFVGDNEPQQVAMSPFEDNGAFFIRHSTRISPMGGLFVRRLGQADRLTKLNFTTELLLKTSFYPQKAETTS